MSIFVIADLHLGTAVAKPMDLFGQRWHEHSKRLAAAWQAAVKPSDTVLLPGDLSWGIRLSEAQPDLAFLHELPGKKVLLRGNHDYWWATLRKLENFCLEQGFNTLHFLQNNALLLEDQWVLAGSRGWLAPDDMRFTKEDRVRLERERGRLALSLAAAAAGQAAGRDLLVICHYPPFGKNLSSSPETKQIAAAGAKACYFGHIHQADSPYVLDKQLIDGVPYSLVAADHLAFAPLKITP